jgi:hypothetical protein
MTFTVVYDANVLYPNTLRDLLLDQAVIPDATRQAAAVIDRVNDGLGAFQLLLLGVRLGLDLVK